MPALCAAIGSFQVKSPRTYLVMVLVTIRVLPFLLTVSFTRCVTLFVSILGVRSYSNQRYSSMQISATRHSLRISTGRTTTFGYSLAGSDVNRDASPTDGAADGSIWRGFGKAAATFPTSATSMG